MRRRPRDLVNLMSLEYREETDDASPDEAGLLPTDTAGKPVYTVTILLGISLVFLTQVYVGLNERQAFAAAFDKPVFRDGSYWLILTGATVHGSWLHVLMNSYALFSFGRIFEELSNQAHLAIVFVISALGGGLLSFAFAPEGSSVGASGGIVGLISYLAVYAFRRRSFISYEFRKSLLINIGFILIFGLVLYQVIDNFGHIGGFITGAVYGFIQIPSDETVDPRVAGRSVELAGLGALGLYLAACVFSILITLNIV